MRITKNTTKEEIINLAPLCRCKDCEHGCTMGSGVFIEEHGELKKLAEHLNITEQELKEKYLEEIKKFNKKRHRPKIKKQENRPYGQCIFFNKETGCKINKVKPFECRIASGCNGLGEEISAWFNLNYFVNENDPESLREYSYYIKSGGRVISGGKLEELMPDKKKRDDILKFEILK